MMGYMTNQSMMP